MENISQEILIGLEKAKLNNESFNLEAILKEIIRKEIEKGINELIAHEMTAYLGYEKNEQGASQALGNARNGTYERMFNTKYGLIKINMPRDRNSEFQTSLFKKRQRSSDNIGQIILKLYSAGMTDSQIQEIVESLYSHKYSTSTISYITDAVKEDVEKFHNRTIKSKYFALFADSIYIPLRRGTVEKEAVNIIMGIDIEGYPEVLAFSISPNENKEEWTSLLSSLISRGLEEVRIFVSDGISCMEEIVKERLPNCLYQRCILHLCRNLEDKVRKDDRDLIRKEFMSLAKKENGHEAIIAFEEFKEKWSKKYKSIKTWSENIKIDTIFNFYRFPKELRSRIYTNNRIEQFNKEIRRQAKAHIQFCDQDAEEKFLVSLFNRYNFRIGVRPIRGKEFIADELIEL